MYSLAYCSLALTPQADVTELQALSNENRNIAWWRRQGSQSSTKAKTEFKLLFSPYLLNKHLCWLTLSNWEWKEVPIFLMVGPPGLNSQVLPPPNNLSHFCHKSFTKLLDMQFNGTLFSWIISTLRKRYSLFLPLSIGLYCFYGCFACLCSGASCVCLCLHRP